MYIITMRTATIVLFVIVAALVWTIARSRSAALKPKLVIALKPSAAAAVLAPRGSATLLEDSTDPKSGAGTAAAMVASSSVAYDLA